MGKSRYSDTGTIDGKFYGTFSLPRRAAGLGEVDLLKGVRTNEYLYKAGDRLDQLASRFFGDEDHWWVIALVNGISYPFSSGGLSPGRILRIPVNVQDILDKVMR